MKFFSNILNTCKRAVGWGQLKDTSILIADSAKSIWSETEKSADINKVQYIQDLGYSQEHLQVVRKRFKMLVSIYFSFAILALLYCFYKISVHDHLSAIVSVTVMLLCLALSFRYHFWLFQIRQGRLGCTWREWLNDLLNKGK